MKLTLGIEEELMVVDADTGDVIADPDPAIFEACVANRGPHQVVYEFLRSQIETGTRVCASIAVHAAGKSPVAGGSRRGGRPPGRCRRRSPQGSRPLSLR